MQENRMKSEIRNPKSEIVRVLLIEDNPGDARLIREMLVEARSIAFALECADRLVAGLERLGQGEIDVILLDLSLPDAQGLDTFVKAHAQVPGVPIVVLTGLDDGALAIEAVQKGAQDYLVKGQVEGNLLVRVLRYAIERHRLLAEVEQAQRREQQERERAARSYQHYLARSQDEGPALSQDEGPTLSGVEGSPGLDTRPQPDKETLYGLLPDYRGLIRCYVHAVRIREDRPSHRVREFARQLAAIRARARDVVRLHLDVLNEFSQRTLPAEDRAFSNDARLVLVELMGNLIDLYLDVAKMEPQK
jgi:DNA-binding NarL/FixJ family response regulator